MGRSHAAAVAALVPSAPTRSATLDPAGDIDDPIGGDLALYQDLAGQLRTLIEQRLKEGNLAPNDARHAHTYARMSECGTGVRTGVRSMKLAVACDHRGLRSQAAAAARAEEAGPRGRGLRLRRHGARSTTRTTPSPAPARSAEGGADVGILMDGSGIGMSIAANKVRGVRAALATTRSPPAGPASTTTATCCASAPTCSSEDQIRQIVEIFLTTPFGDGRHAARVGKLKLLEEEERAGPTQQSHPRSQAWTLNPVSSRRSPRRRASRLIQRRHRHRPSCGPSTTARTPAQRAPPA